MKTSKMPMPILFLIIFSLINYGHCLTCLTCEMTTQPRHCHTVSTCTTGEVCYTKRVQTHDLQIAYQLGCIDQQVCTENNMTDIHHKCEHCCSSDLCNAEACGEIGYPSIRGPICYGCTARTANKPCGYIDFCAQDEVCSIVDEEEFGDVLTTTGCKNKHLCEAHIDGVLVGKRASQHTANTDTNITTLDDPLSIANCRRCCPLDLCNLQCQHTPDIVSYWSKWSDWNICSPTCGHNNGSQQRTRVCEESGVKVSSEKCTGANLDMRACSIPQCPGDWLYWSSWTTCGPSCGNTNGTQQRHRNCNNMFHYGQCVGTASETQQCLIPKCEGTWLNWASWTACSPACGTNITQHRTRDCNNTVYQGQCVGVDTETKQCSPTVCVVNDCSDVLKAGLSTGDGLYNITVDAIGQTEIVEVFCDMTTDNGGWTVFQYRYNGSVDFYRNYYNYTEGFGRYPGEFWLGLKWIHSITSKRNYILKVDLKGLNTTSQHTVAGFALYTDFSVGPASGSYILHVADKLDYHNGSAFSTSDHDADMGNGNCAVVWHSPFWHYNCYHVNLNGQYLTPGTDDTNSMNWESWPSGPSRLHQSLLSSKLSFKPI